MYSNIVETTILKYSKKLKGTYIFYSDEIPPNIITNARITHGLTITDIVWILIDTGRLVNNGKCSVLFLNTDISISYGSSLEGFDHRLINWGILSDIDFKEGHFVFYGSSENDFVSWSVDDILNSNDQNSRNIDAILSLISDIISQFKEEEEKEYRTIESIKHKFYDFYDNNDFENALVIADDFIKNNPASYLGYYWKIKPMIKLKKYDESLKCVEKYTDLLKQWKIEPDKMNEIDTWYFALFCYAKSDCYVGLGKFHEALWMNRLSHQYLSEKSALELSNERFIGIYEDYKNTLLSEKWEDRKVIYVVDEWPDFKRTKYDFTSSPELKCLLKNNMPAIQFPNGHPLSNTLYFAHPYYKNSYFTLESFQTELFVDKFWELCKLLQCLGATNIKVIISDKKSSIEEQKQENNITGNMSMIKSGSVSFESNIESKMKSTLARRISGNQNFNPKYKPFIPNNLNWYHSEISWQRLTDQRLSGGLSSSRIALTLKANEMLSKTERIKIDGEFNALIFKAKGAYERNIDFKVSEEIELEQEIDVKFAPIESLTLDYIPEKKNIKTNLDNLNSNEVEYIELLKDCLEDGKISDDEARILDRKRSKLNIGKERALEIERNLQMKSLYKAEEIEYMDEIKFYLENDNNISFDERRILERIRIKLGISVERASELEDSARKSE